MSSKLAKYGHFGRNDPVQYKVEGTPEKPALRLSIAYENAPVPEHYYVADYFQIVPLDLEVLLIFGKLDHPNDKRLRNKIEIFFPVYLFVTQLWKSSRDFEKTIAEFVERGKAQAITPSQLPPETDKVQTLHSNNVLMVMSTGQCIMDFFYISAKELWLRPPRNEALGIEALVRVIAPASLVLGFLRESDRVATLYKERLGDEFEEQEEEHETVESQ